MPRHARLRLADLPLHVIHRGNNRSVCFRQPKDFALYLSLMREFSTANECEIHAYVLMTNHVHLLLTPRNEQSVSQFMKDVAQRFSQFVNRTYERSGCLWEGRFRSSIVDSDAYLMRCYRYIEMNPVRARLSDHPSGYSWSSYASNGMGATNPLLTPHEQYAALGKTPDERQASYRNFLREDLAPGELEEIRKAVKGGFVLGHPTFIQEMARRLGTHASPRPGGRPKKNQGQTTIINP